MLPSATLRSRRERGAGLVETMIGILIGLLVVLVIYNVFSVTEGYKRFTAGLSDAQITGQLAQFFVSRDLGNGGNGLSLSADDLIQCNDVTLRPIPVLITDGGSVDKSDSFVTMYSAAEHVLWPVDFQAPAPAGTAFTVQSPNGFNVNDRVIAIAKDGTGNCEMSTVTAIAGPDPVTGFVVLTHTATTKNYFNTGGNPSTLVNMGQVGLATRTLYEVWNTNTNKTCATGLEPCQLFTTDLLTAGAVRNPIVSNVVLMKIQYGIDSSNPLDGIIDCWAPATTAAVSGDPCATGTDYSPAAVQAMPTAELSRIQAVRIGLVVRSDEPDLKDPSLVFAKRPPYFLFNCSGNTNALCPGRIQLSNNIIQDTWRYRIYDTVIALKNPLYQVPP